MPRKKRTIIEETLPEGQDTETGEISDLDVALESVEDAETLRNVLEQHGQTGAMFKIYRQTSSGDEFCYTSDAIDEEFIQKNFGGGDFKIRVFLNGKFRIPMKIKIAPRIVDNTNGNGNGYHPDLQHNAFLEKMLLTLLAKENGGSPTATPTIIDLTTALSNLDGLRGKQESAMELFQKGVSFAKEIFEMKNGGSGDWKSDLINGVKDALPTVAGMLSGRPPAPLTTERNNVLTEQPNPEQQRLLIQGGLNYLKKKCLAGLQPDFIIEWVENNAEDYQPLIHMALNLPFEEFVKIDAEIEREPFKQWFTELFNGLRSAFISPDSVGVDTPGDGGGRDDVGDNGNVGKDTKRKGK
jgi:hypothetical protein